VALLLNQLKLYIMHLFIAKLMFTLKLYSGVIIPSDDVDGRTIYSIPSAGIEYAYKAEIIQYLETGVFTYDETLDDSVDLSEVTKSSVKL
jgi:hypothetical protein